MKDFDVTTVVVVSLIVIAVLLLAGLLLTAHGSCLKLMQARPAAEIVTVCR